MTGLTQSNPWLGMWKINLAKSTYAPGQAPRSSTYNFQGAGANLTNTVDTVDAAGNSTKGVNMHNYDGQPHPGSGNPSVDARSYTRARCEHGDLRQCQGRQTGSGRYH